MQWGPTWQGAADIPYAGDASIALVVTGGPEGDGGGQQGTGQGGGEGQQGKEQPLTEAALNQLPNGRAPSRKEGSSVRLGMTVMTASGRVLVDSP